MDKQKQIEEMAYELTQYEYKLCERLPKNECLLTSHIHAQVCCDYCKIAEFLIEQGYRKIPENAVVIDKNEKSTEKQLEKLGYIKLKNDKIVISLEEQGRSLLDAYYKGKDEATAVYEERLKTVRKETAEKFAEMVKERIYSHDYLLQDTDDLLVQEIYEICDKITEGKV